MHTSSWISRAVGVCSVTAMLLASGCSSGGAPTPGTGTESTAPNQASGEPKSAGIITIGFEQEPDTFDIAKSSGSSATDYLVGLIGAGLFYKDPSTGEVKPHLAESYTISEDGKTLTFKIRSGVTFHDGTALTAKVYKQTFDRIFDPKTEARAILGLLEEVEVVEAPDDQTLIVQLKEPFAPFLNTLTDAGRMQPLSMQAIESHGADYGRNPVGVGAWKFESWQTGQSVTFSRNDDFQWAEPFYENQGPVKPDSLVFKFIRDDATMLAALDSGGIDVATNVNAKDAKKYRGHDKFEVLEKMRSGMGLFVEMNMKTEALQDVQVRKALNMAINKEAIIQAALQGEGVIAHSFLPPNYLGYDKAVEELGYTYNQEEAQKLLESAGWIKNADGVREKNGKTLAFTLLSRQNQAKESQLIQAMLGAVGVKVTINTLEPGAMIDAAIKGQFDLTVMGYTHDDPDILYLFWHSSQIGAWNFASVNDPKLDELAEKGRKTINLEERNKVYLEAQKYMIEQAYLIPIYVDKEFTVVNKRVKGIRFGYHAPVFNDSWVAQ